MTIAHRHTHISEITVKHFDIAVYDLQCYQLIVSRTDTTNEEQRRISPIDDLGIYTSGQPRSVDAVVL